MTNKIGRADHLLSTDAPAQVTSADREAAERAAVVAWLRKGWGGAWELATRNMNVGRVHLPQLLADAIERGDHRIAHEGTSDE